jgi:hypothetical protein
MPRLASWLLLLFSTVVLFAQAPTGAINGQVTVAGSPTAGVDVVASGPAPVGSRTTTTSAGGDYSLTALPPGSYQIRFEFRGAPPQTRTFEIHAGDALRIDVALQITTEMAISVPVAAIADTPQVSSTFDSHLVELLPIGRSILDAVRIAPGVQDTGGQGQLVINGAQSYDNLYLVNGVTVGSEVSGQPHNLFIEDAIQETTVLGAGVSAEYGRFTGGVVSVITKSGGNELSGSLRDTLTSDKWTAKTPYPEPDHLDQIDNNYEATLGGRIVRDRLWFFAAGRYASRGDARQTFGTNVAYTHRIDDNRYEAKLTANLSPRHSIVGSYINATAKRFNDGAGVVADVRALSTASLPNSLAALHYTGILHDNLVAEAQYSRKRYETGAFGGTSTDPLVGTQLIDITSQARAWAPLLCGVCGKSFSNNRDFIAKATWFAATSRFGSHSVIAGVDDFNESYFDNSHQTASDFMVITPLLFANHDFITQAVPGVTEIVWQPIVEPAQATSYRSLASFVNDRIDFGTRVSISAGLRYDANRGHDGNGTLAIDDSRISPRVGVVYDLFGDGRHRISASYSVYAAKISEPATFDTTIAGSPAYLLYDYEGPELNTSGESIPTQEVLRQLFAWFHSVDPEEFLIDSFYPGGAELAGALKSPYAREMTAGYGIRLGTKGMLRGDYVHRRWGSFYARRATLGTGKTTTAGGQVVDRIEVENSDAGLRRKYDGVLMQGTYQFLKRFSLGGNYTWSRLTGNVENENPSGVAASVAEPGAFYPEYTNFAQNAPTGYLASDVRHRANVWLVSTWKAGRSQIDVSLLERYHSARNYNATAFIDMRRVITTNPGYAAPQSANYFFAPRGSLRVDDVSATDVAFNWAFPILKSQLFAEADLQNVFNEQAVENPGAIDKRVNINRNDRNLAIFNPFTTTPVECPQGTPTSSAGCRNIANYQLVPTFGTPVSKGAYQQPRTLRVSVGVRF